MSDGIPKSAREVLAKQAAADAHPSPDLLNAYAERALSEAEKQQVTLHLASCSECREVLFLAGAAAEELEPALSLAAAKQDRMAAATIGQGEGQGSAVLQRRPKQPKMWWKWAMPLAAVVIVGAAVLVERDRMAGRFEPAGTETAYTKPAPAQPMTSAPAEPSAATDKRGLPQAVEGSPQTKAVVTQPPAVASKAKPQERARLDAQQTQLAVTARPANAPSERETQFASKVESAHSPALAPGALPPPPVVTAGTAADAAKTAKAAPSAAASQSVEVTSAAPLVSSGNELNNQSPEAKPQAMAKALTGDQVGALTTLEMDRSSEPVKTRWRISRDGHVEHTVGPNTWERVMAAEPVTFHVVATVGNSVWAGGSEGALFHSGDGGRHWERVALADEHGTITTIHFKTAQQGSVTSDSGATWATSDGGRTWSKQ